MSREPQIRPEGIKKPSPPALPLKGEEVLLEKEEIGFLNFVIRQQLHKDEKSERKFIERDGKLIAASGLEHRLRIARALKKRFYKLQKQNTQASQIEQIDLKMFFFKEGDPCRKCKTPLDKVKPRKQGGTSKMKYYYAYFYQCPKCETIYMPEDGKRNFVDGKRTE